MRPVQPRALPTVDWTITPNSPTAISSRARAYQYRNVDETPRPLPPLNRIAVDTNMMIAEPSTICRSSVPPSPWTKKVGIFPERAVRTTAVTASKVPI